MNKINYTVTGKTDGFGAQYLSVMSGIAFCKANCESYNYIHTPFKSIAHSRGKEESLNNFIGIPDTLYNKNNEEINETVPFSKSVHWANKHTLSRRYYNNNTIELLRKYYYSSPKPDIENIDIAIHIRRGNVGVNAPGDRYTSNSDYNKIIKFLNVKYPNYKIVIFSEGKVDDFKELIGNNISFRLNGCIEETFHSLVCAKILVVAKSTFSYSAAILNPNEIYYIKFRHGPLEHWKVITEFI